jgi:drug/metabolite transporter (DMT)-like permease
MLFAMLIWGLSWTNGKILGRYTTATVLMFWRFLLATLSFLPFLLVFRQSLRIPRQGFFHTVVGALMLVLYNYAYFRGTHIGLAGTGGVLVTTLNPIITFALSALIYRFQIHRKDIAGLLLGLAGGALLLRAWTLQPAEIFGRGNLYFLTCSTAWAILTVTSYRTRNTMNPLTFSFWTISLATIVTIPLNLRNPLFQIFTYDGIFWLNLGLISAGAMAFATTIYFLGTTRLGSEKASAFIFAVPVSALVFSMLFLGERLEPATVVGCLLAMTAVYLINKQPVGSQPD